MLQQKMSSSKETAGGAGSEAAVLKFDAVSAVRGIAFHLLDEKLAKSVSADAIQRTIERLGARSFHPVIPRDPLTMMTNSQRLNWLLSESQTLTLMGTGDVVFLRARRSR